MSIISPSCEVEPHQIAVDSASAEEIINRNQITTQLVEEEEEEAEKQELIKKNFNKNANAAEKVIAEQIRRKRKLEKINKSKSQSPKQSTVSTKATTLQHSTKVVAHQHQSVNKQTPGERGGEGGSDGKASKKSADNASSHTHGSATKKRKTVEKKQNSNETANCIRDGKEQSYYDKSNKNNQFDERNDGSINFKQLSSEEERETVVERQWKSQGEKKILDLIEISSSSYLDIDAIIKIYNNGFNCSSSYNSTISDNFTTMSTSLLEFPNIPPVDLDALKQQSLLGEAVVSNLREIDVKLMELHKRKMFFDEMILKLQKDKLETDLQTMKLQNEKFMLLNTAMTANATAAAARNVERSLLNNAKIAAKVERENRKTTKTPAVDTQKRKATKLDVENTCCRVKRPYRKRATKDSKNSTHAKASTGNKIELEATATIVVDAIAPRTMHSSEEIDFNANKNTTPMESDDGLDESTTTTTDYSNISCGSVEGIKSPLTQIRIFEDYIIASSEDGNLYKFNIKTLQLEEHFAKHSEAITQMYICRLKKLIYTTSLDGYLKKTSIENFELDIQSLYLQEPLQSIEVKWGVAFIGSRWGNIFTYDIATSKIAESMLCSSDASIIAIKAVKEGARKIIIVSSKGNLIHLRDARTGLLLRTLDVPEHVHIYSLLLDDGAIYCGTQKKEIYKYDFTTGTHLATLVCGNGAVSLKLFKHKYLLVGCYDGYIYVLDKETSEQIDCFPGSGKMVLTMEIAGNKLITSAKDKTMKITDIPEHIITKTLNI